MKFDMRRDEIDGRCWDRMWERKRDEGERSGAFIGSGAIISKLFEASKLSNRRPTRPRI